MDTRYHRPPSPRRLVNPGRSSTGTFATADPYYDSYYANPRASNERVVVPSGSSHHHPTYNYAPSTSSRAVNAKYDTYNTSTRRNTLNDDDRPSRPVTTAPITVPSRSHGLYADRPSSPLARSWDTRGETYITHPSARREHKRIYSVDDNSHSAKLVAERDVIEPPRRHESKDRYGNVTSGGRSYHQNKPLIRTTDVSDDGYSYTDAAGMYRDTEPAWRRTRSGSVERGSRPTSMIMERGPRTSTRELGPPPSTRGFDKLNSGISRNGSLREHKSSPRDAPSDKYRDAEPYTAPHRSSSARHHHAPAIHQDSREHRRETFHDDYDRRDRDPENRRQNTYDRFEDRDIASRGFGIRTDNPKTSRDDVLDRQPVWNAHETGRNRQAEYGDVSYPAPDHHRHSVQAMPEPRISTYDERPRERERLREREPDERSHVSPIVPVAAGAAATYGATEVLKSREKDKERQMEFDRERRKERDVERERDRREREDRRDRDDRAPLPPPPPPPSEDRRDRAQEDRRERLPLPEEPRGVLPERRDKGPQDPGFAPAAAAYASTQDIDRMPRERRYEDDERSRRHRAPSSDQGSNDDHPRHYIDRDDERRRESPSKKEPTLDPDEEYRRRIQQEQERSRTRDYSDSDREKDRRRRKEGHDRGHERDLDEGRSHGPRSDTIESTRSRYDERSNSVFDRDIVQEPDSLSGPAEEKSKSVQIVTPPKDPPAAPKGILRKPTEKFPEHPDSIREGVAPHKSQLKGKDIPVNARWTKIDRRLVNPQALEEAKERFEERMDCVIVLRVLTKAEIQKLADRTREIREEREDEQEHRSHRDRDRDQDDHDEDRERRHRSRRDEEDRRRDYEDDDDDDDDRERGRNRPRMIEN